MKNNSESAIPKLFKQKEGENGERFFYNNGGLSKREWLAGLAMQNVQNVFLRRSNKETLQGAMQYHGTNSVHKTIAKEALMFADALLAELAKEQE